jgi:predicted lipoprotein with Yx(FWY)xxD motif
MHIRFVALALFGAATVAACGGGGGSSGGGSPTVPNPGPSTSATNPPSMPQQATVAGSTAFVGQNGHTLYMFSIDGNNVSNCTSASSADGVCTQFWPPLAAPAGTVAPKGTGFAVFTRSDGTLQWSYNGHPLYEYVLDTAAGQDTGQGNMLFGGLWTTARPAGTATSAPSTAPTSSPTAPPTGY